jgi:hypothetical protein
MRGADTPFEGWLADIGANLLCVVLVLLVLLSLAPALPSTATDAPPVLPIVRAAPVSGTEGVRLLSHLVIPPEDQMVLALGPEGPRLRVSTTETTFVAPKDLPRDAPAATLHVFDPRHHAATVAALRTRAIPFAEITVPEALRAPAQTDDDDQPKPSTSGHSLWAPDYIAALDGVRSLTGYRAALRSHLDRVATGTGGPDLTDADGTLVGTASRLANRFEALRRNINLILLGIGLATCLLIYRAGRIKGAGVGGRGARTRPRGRRPAPPSHPR